MPAVLLPVDPSITKPTGTAVVSVDHISKTYPVSFLRLKKAFKRKFKPPVEAVRDVSFAVREGEIFGLIGPNGAGKTTLAKMIATLIQPTEGQVTVKGFDSVRDDVAVRRSVGLAGAEERSFYWRLSVEQNLLFFARLHGLSNSDATKRISDLLQMLQLEDSARKRFAGFQARRSVWNFSRHRVGAILGSVLSDATDPRLCRQQSRQHLARAAADLRTGWYSPRADRRAGILTSTPALD